MLQKRTEPAQTRFNDRITKAMQTKLQVAMAQPPVPWAIWSNWTQYATDMAQRSLEFARWWGGLYLMNREEIAWIVQSLFVGNKVWSSAAGGDGKVFDLRQIRSPIVLFASMGDNITPPQQAFNWVADVYGSTDEIKANRQVIVGLLHEDVGHLGIFVSGKVATKEHAQIVDVMKPIESLPSGRYGMQIGASLDYYRDVRDAISEAQFFMTFGVMFPALRGERSGKAQNEAAAPVAARDLPVVREALAAVDQGG